MKKAFLKMQCKDQIGKIGTFAVDEDGKQITPTFKDMYAFTKWINRINFLTIKHKYQWII